MPTFGPIPISPGAGLLIDAVGGLVVAGQTVVRETTVLADPSAPGNYAAVTAAGALKVDPSGVIQSVVPGVPPVGGTTRTNVTTSAAGWTQIVAGAENKTVRLWRLIVSANQATTVSIGDGTTAFLGPYCITANGTIELDISGEPWWVSAPSFGLQVNSSNAVPLTVSAWTTQS